MGTFLGGVMLDRRTYRSRAVAGVTLVAVDVATGETLPTLSLVDQSTPQPVTTNGDGAYGDFYIADRDIARLTAGGVSQVVVSAEVLAGEARSLAKPVATADDLPAVERDGSLRITQDDLHLWVWDDMLPGWTDLGSLKGADGSGASDADIAARVTTEGTQTRTAVADLVDARAVGKGELVVHVRDFGAVGDGVTDDTASIQAAVDAVRDAGGGILQFDPLTYVVTSVNIQAGLTVVGNGATIKRPASQPNWTRTFTNQNRIPTASSTDAPAITMRGLTLDGNRADQGAYTSYQLEQAVLLFVQGNPAGTGRQVLILDNVTFKDSVSDGVHVWKNVDATLTNVRGIDCFRGGIVASGGWSVLRVDGYRGYGTVHGAHIDQEIDSPGFGGSMRCDAYFKGVRLETSYPTARSLNVSAFDGATVQIDSSEFASGFYFYGPAGKIKVRDSTLHAFQHASYQSVYRSTSADFVGCDFVGHTAGTLSTRHVVTVTPHPDAPMSVGFRDCSFTVADLAGGDSWTGVRTEAVASAGHRFDLRVRGGRFGPSLGVGVVLARGGFLEIDGRARFESKRIFTATGVNAEARPFDITIGQVDLAPTCTEGWGFGNNEATNVLRHVGTFVDAARNVITAGGPGFGSTTTSGGRIIEVTSPPTGATHGLRGDRARLRVPVSGAVAEWVCTTPGTSTAVWKAATTLA